MTKPLLSGKYRMVVIMAASASSAINLENKETGEIRVEVNDLMRLRSALSEITELMQQVMNIRHRDNQEGAMRVHESVKRELLNTIRLSDGAMKVSAQIVDQTKKGRQSELLLREEKMASIWISNIDKSLRAYYKMLLEAEKIPDGNVFIGRYYSIKSSIAVLIANINQLFALENRLRAQIQAEEGNAKLEGKILEQVISLEVSIKRAIETINHSVNLVHRGNRENVLPMLESLNKDLAFDSKKLKVISDYSKQIKQRLIAYRGHDILTAEEDKALGVDAQVMGEVQNVITNIEKIKAQFKKGEVQAIMAELTMDRDRLNDILRKIEEIKRMEQDMVSRGG